MANSIHGQHGYPHQMPTRLMKHNLFLKLEKCAFKQPSIEFLGIQITQGEVQMDNTKVEKVRNWKVLMNITEVCKFLGFTGYYHYFIKDYSKITQPLLQLTHLTNPWSWKQEEQTAFKILQEAMVNRLVL
jgi:hypothetical protein